MFVVVVRYTTSVVGSNLVSLEEKQGRPGKLATADDCRCLVGVGRRRLLVELEPRHLAASPRRPPRGLGRRARSRAVRHPGQLRVPGAVVFLASDYASWITGTDHLVDGGSHLRGLPDYIGYLLPGQE